MCCITAKHHNLIYIFSKPCQPNVRNNYNPDIFFMQEEDNELTELSTSSNITSLISLQDQAGENVVY